MRRFRLRSPPELRSRSGSTTDHRFFCLGLYIVLVSSALLMFKLSCVFRSRGWSLLGGIRLAQPIDSFKVGHPRFRAFTYNLSEEGSLRSRQPSVASSSCDKTASVHV